MKEIRRGNFVSGEECRRKPFSVRRYCTRVPVLAYCCFILSIGALQWSAVEASSKAGIHLLSPSFVRSPGPRLPFSSSAALVNQQESEGWLDRRQRRSPTNDVIISAPMNPASEAGGDDSESLSDLLRESPWALVALRENPGGNRHTLSFTPRLGRDSGEEKEEEDTFLEEEEEEEEEEDEEMAGGSHDKRRTPPFAPRLGRRVPARRRVIPFVPRMGRRRLRDGAEGGDAPSRGTGNPDRHFLFSPRLGRSASPAESVSRPGTTGAAASEDGGTKEA